MLKITLKGLFSFVLLLQLVGCGGDDSRVGGTDLDTPDAEKQAEAARAAYAAGGRKAPGSAEAGKK